MVKGQTQGKPGVCSQGTDSWEARSLAVEEKRQGLSRSTFGSCGRLKFNGPKKKTFMTPLNRFCLVNQLGKLTKRLAHHAALLLLAPGGQCFKLLVHPPEKKRKGGMHIIKVVLGQLGMGLKESIFSENPAATSTLVPHTYRITPTLAATQ